MRDITLGEYLGKQHRARRRLQGIVVNEDMYKVIQELCSKDMVSNIYGLPVVVSSHVPQGYICWVDNDKRVHYEKVTLA